jgi:glycosyltransferase involved in cell wall biosynthesis
MRVVQSVHSKFHHFDLARQLHRRGMLQAIFTGYPRWKLKDEGLPPEKIRTFPWLRTLIMAKARFGVEIPWFDRELNWQAAVLLDAYVASRLPSCDVFVGLSGGGLRTGRLVQRRGGRYICDRGSPHVRYAEELRAEEFARWAQRFPGVDPRAIVREEQEYACADLITVPSQFCVRSFVEMGVPREKIRKIPYGVELSRFRKLADPPQDCFEVLFVGRVAFHKGVPYLLEAFKALRHPRKRLRVVGPIDPEMKAFVRERHHDHVQFLGALPQSALASILSSSHVMVLPSVVEGFGMVLGQAMACGCPVICSSNTGADEIVQDGLEGFVVPIRNSRAITEKLEGLSQDRASRDRMSEAALARVRGLGGWDEYGDNYAELCRRLAAGAPVADPARLSVVESTAASAG